MNTHHINILRLANYQKGGSVFVGAIADLNVTAFDDTTITLDWTTPSADNPIDYYEVYLDGVFYENTTDASEGWVVTGLTAGTSYDITLKTVDDVGNKSGFSNEVTQATGVAVPIANITHYYNFNSQVLDQVGVKNGTVTAITYLSGLIGNAADFNGTTSRVSLPSNVLSNTEFSIVVLIKGDTTSGEQRYLLLNNNSSAYTLLRFNAGSAGRIGSLVYDGASKVVDYNGGTLTDWNSIILTAKTGVNMKLYVNGVLRGTTAIGTFTEVGASGNMIGANADATGFFYNGKINALGILNIQMDDTQALACHTKLMVDNQHLIP